MLASLNKKGDFKDGVLKVNIPRSDLHVTIGGRPAPTPFGFGGWLALAKGDAGMHVMMGDLVLTEDEVNPVMSVLLQNGIDVTALHNHFFHEQPRVFYMHVHGMGEPADLARRVKPAVDLIDRAAPGPPVAAGPAPLMTLDVASSPRSSGTRASSQDRSTRSPSAGPTSTFASMAPPSRRGWDSTRGLPSERTPTRWSPGRGDARYRGDAGARALRYGIEVWRSTTT